MQDMAGMTVAHPAGVALFTYDDTGWIVMVFHTCGELALIAHRRTPLSIQRVAYQALQQLALMGHEGWAQ
jgi:hypothetical protein